MKNWIKLQPIDEIKDYLGVKGAFYFAWLGFYTQLLIPAALFGLIVVVYGLFTLKNDIYRYTFVCSSLLYVEIKGFCAYAGHRSCQFFNRVQDWKSFGNSWLRVSLRLWLIESFPSRSELVSVF